MAERTPRQLLAEAIGNAFIREHDDMQARAKNILNDVESEETRRELAASNPAMARAIESSTLEERERHSETVAIAIGVAAAIIEAFQRLGLDVPSN